MACESWRPEGPVANVLRMVARLPPKALSLVPSNITCNLMPDGSIGEVEVGGEVDVYLMLKISDVREQLVTYDPAFRWNTLLPA